MARGCDLTALDGIKDRASLLLRVRAVEIFTLAVMLAELAHRVGERVEGEEIEVFEVDHRKSGRVGKKSAALKRKELRLACGVLSARDLSADLTRRELHFGEKSVDESRFADSRCARKCGNLAPQPFFYIGRKLFDSVALVAGEGEGGIERGLVCFFKLFGNLSIQLGFTDDNYRLYSVIFGNREELVDRFCRGGGRRRGADDDENVEI